MKQTSWYAIVLGLLIIGAFGYLCYFMLNESQVIDNDAGKYKWDRLVLLFNAVQSMAAAALGAILGTTVQQARVDAAQAKADANAGDAVKVAAARAAANNLQPPGAAPDPTLEAIKRILE